MAKEKKQFRELSDEDLKQVTGGDSFPGFDKSISHNIGFGLCLDFEKDENGNCKPGLTVTN